ncbi:MAG TPA: VOC family protein [Rhizomicrobium sp.]|jgi:PhnB protein
MKANAYLNFDGNCAEAFQFYAKTFPGTGLHIMRQGDMQKDAKAPEKDWVIHAYVKIGDTELMASDTFNHGYTKPAGMNVALNVDTPAEAERIFKALSEGGNVTMKMEETFFAHKFGMVVDRFGTPWMVVNSKPMG